MPEEKLDSRIESYLRLAILHDNLRPVSRDVTNITVSDLTKASGGMTNKVYSFLLTYSTSGFEHNLRLILKTYPDAVDLFKINRPGEDVRKYVREFEAMRSLENVGFPVPHVYLCECDPFFMGFPFVIMNKETAIQDKVDYLDNFASTLARLHNLEVSSLGIKSLVCPQDNSEFAREWSVHFRNFLRRTTHYKSLKKDFCNAIDWLGSNAQYNCCSRYCLIHGEYHPNHTIMTNDKVLKVFDWENVAIGDPAFDVGYAYHIVKLMYQGRNPNSGEKTAEHFISEYTKNFKGDIAPRLDFYKVVGIVGVTMAVSSFMSNPLEAFKHLGYKGLTRSLAFPFFRFSSVGKRWLDAEFIVSYLHYCQDFLRKTISQ